MPLIMYFKHFFTFYVYRTLKVKLSINDDFGVLKNYVTIVNTLYR